MDKELNKRLETLKLLEKNIRGRIHNIGLGCYFMDMTPEAQKTKASETTPNNRKVLHSKAAVSALYREHKECKPHI